MRPEPHTGRGPHRPKPAPPRKERRKLKRKQSLWIPQLKRPGPVHSVFTAPLPSCSIMACMKNSPALYEDRTMGPAAT